MLLRMLPWRAREAIKSRKTKRYLGQALDALPPLEVATRDLRAEVHMMLGKNHLYRGLAALRTFFHHSGLSDRVGVMFHSDGTIRPRHRRLLEKHIHGAEFTRYPSKDPRVAEVFKNRPYCADYYRRGLSCQPKLVHIPVFARVDRVIQLDSDVAFWGRPDAIIDCVNGPEARPMYQIDHNKKNPDPGADVRQHFDELRHSLDSLRERSFEIKSYYFCSGIMLLPVRRFSFDIVEDYFRWHATECPAHTKRELHWFWDWTVEQTAYMLNFATWPDAIPLDAKYPTGDVPGGVCNHFLGMNYSKDSSLHRIRQTLRDIASKR